MRPIVLTRSLSVAAAVAGVAALQQLAAPGDMLINGTLASGGVATIGEQRRVTINSAADFSLTTFTIYGTDSQGRTISESLAGPTAGATVTSTLDYATVTRVASSTALGTDTRVGTSAVGASQTLPLDIYLPYGSTVSVQLVSGAANYTVQVSNSDPFPADASTALVWSDHPVAALVGASASQIGVTANAYRAMRLLTNSGTGVLKITITQQGLAP